MTVCDSGALFLIAIVPLSRPRAPFHRRFPVKITGNYHYGNWTAHNNDFHRRTRHFSNSHIVVDTDVEW